MIDGFDAPAPWAVGVNFDGIPNTQIGLGLMGGDRVMARLTTGGDIGGWFGRGRESKSYSSQPAFFKPHRTSSGGPEQMALNAEVEKIFLMDIQTNDAAAKADVYLRPGDNTPNLVGRSVRHMANGAGKDIESFILIPRKYGLRGPTLRLSRRDFEGALVHDRGSSDEIWANAEFDDVKEDEFTKTASLTSARFQWMDWKDTRLILDNDIGLSEDDEAMLYRTALLAENRHQIHKHVVYGGALRFNIADNFRELREFRLLPARPVRSDIDLFTLRTLSVEDSFVSTMATPLPGFHIMGTGGYLEEQYAGIGGEVLYRPFGKRYAVGGELYKVYKRSPYTDFNLGLSGDDALTGTLDAYYELPETGITLHAGAGRYLAGDWGAEFGLKRHFNNGAHLGGLVRISDQEETDVFGERTHAYGGLALTLPFGQSRHIPDGSEIRLDFKPQGRDTAQRLNKPMDLYEMTEPFSMRHISENWAEVLK